MSNLEIGLGIAGALIFLYLKLKDKYFTSKIDKEEAQRDKDNDVINKQSGVIQVDEKELKHALDTYNKLKSSDDSGESN